MNSFYNDSLEIFDALVSRFNFSYVKHFISVSSLEGAIVKTSDFECSLSEIPDNDDQEQDFSDDEEILEYLTESERNLIKLRGPKFKDLAQEDCPFCPIEDNLNKIKGDCKRNFLSLYDEDIEKCLIQSESMPSIKLRGQQKCNTSVKEDCLYCQIGDSISQIQDEYEHDFLSSDEEDLINDFIRPETTRIETIRGKCKPEHNSGQHFEKIIAVPFDPPTPVTVRYSEKEGRNEEEKSKFKTDNQVKGKQFIKSVNKDKISSCLSPGQSSEDLFNYSENLEKSKQLRVISSRGQLSEVTEKDRDLCEWRQVVADVIQHLYTILRQNKLCEDPLSVASGYLMDLQNDMVEKINTLIYLNKRELDLVFNKVVLIIDRIHKENKCCKSQSTVDNFTNNIIVCSLHRIEYSNFPQNLNFSKQLESLNSKLQDYESSPNNTFGPHQGFEISPLKDADADQKSGSLKYADNRSKEGTRDRAKKLCSFLHRLIQEKPKRIKTLKKELHSICGNSSKNLVLSLVQNLSSDSSKIESLYQKNEAFYNKIQEIRNIITKAGININLIKNFKTTEKFEMITGNNEYILARVLVNLGLKTIPQDSVISTFPQEIKEYHAPFLIWMIENPQSPESTAYICSSDGRKFLLETLRNLDCILKRKKVNLGASKLILDNALKKIEDFDISFDQNHQAIEAQKTNNQYPEELMSNESTQSTLSPESDNISIIDLVPRSKLNRKVHSERCQDYENLDFFSLSDNQEDYERKTDKKVRMNPFNNHYQEDLLRFLKDNEGDSFLDNLKSP